MIRVVGQALWVVETGAALIDPYAPRALSAIFVHLNQGVIEFDTHPDVLFCERIKAEALIGPPPAPEPILTYAIWYRSRIGAMGAGHRMMYSVHGAVQFGPPDIPVRREYVLDLYADITLQHGQGPTDTRLIWIDIKRTRPSTPPPTTVLEALDTP